MNSEIIKLIPKHLGYPDTSSPQARVMQKLVRMRLYEQRIKNLKPDVVVRSIAKIIMQVSQDQGRRRDLEGAATDAKRLIELMRGSDMGLMNITLPEIDYVLTKKAMEDEQFFLAPLPIFRVLTEYAEGIGAQAHQKSIALIENAQQAYRQKQIGPAMNKYTEMMVSNATKV